MSSNEKLPTPSFALPSPVFQSAQPQTSKNSHFLSPNGIQELSRNEQPPPMYGPRGSTIPPKHFAEYGKGKLTEPTKEYCDVCDWEFKNVVALRYHQNEHEECAVEGCDFRAHPKVVDTHIQMSHQSGIFDQIKKLDSPEDIAKWREARKKRYPTIENVQMRQQMQQEKQKRGEKLEPRNNRFGRSSERTNVVQTGKRATTFQKPVDEKKMRFNEKVLNKKEPMEKLEATRTEKKLEVSKLQIESPKEVRDEDMWNDGLPMFTGTSKWKDYNRVQIKGKASALACLLGSYGSDSDSDENIEDGSTRDVESSSNDDFRQHLIPQPKSSASDLVPKSSEEPIAKVEDNIDVNEKVEIKDNMEVNEKSEDDSPPEESPIQRKPCLLTISGVLSGANDNFIDSKQPKPETSKKSKKKLSGLEANMGFLLRKTRKQNTMLEKLLETQIIHERNVLLQCVRHVVSNNFFQENKNKDASD